MGRAEGCFQQTCLVWPRVPPEGCRGHSTQAGLLWPPVSDSSRTLAWVCPKAERAPTKAGVGLCPALRPTHPPRTSAGTPAWPSPSPPPPLPPISHQQGPSPGPTTAPHGLTPVISRAFCGNTHASSGARPRLLLPEDSSKTHTSRPPDCCPRMDAKTAPGALPT